jgi:hypothetical protein
LCIVIAPVVNCLELTGDGLVNDILSSSCIGYSGHYAGRKNTVSSKQNARTVMFFPATHHACIQSRVSLFRFKKKMRNEAKRSEKDAKTNSKLARGSETKQNKVRMPQFRLHEPLKTILTHKETCEKFASFACFFMV